MGKRELFNEAGSLRHVEKDFDYANEKATKLGLRNIEPVCIGQLNKTLSAKESCP